ncbi:aminotriazole resistance protein [Aspergillus flavus]|uniref:Aminotriazole resistance protein n=1 Tax=Aspergillus flavus TaxID=5059 RepID=A0AB74C2R5_ASPFL|nr:aminotriazole resistance protein [Aspergillus flavus]
MASEVALSQDGQRPNELGNEPKQEHVSTRPSLEDQSNEGKPPKNTALIIFCISCITFISCYLGGLVTVSVPAISKDLSLDPGVELWPVSMYALATECTLLISGAVSDAVGSRPVFLIACFL